MPKRSYAGAVARAGLAAAAGYLSNKRRKVAPRRRMAKKMRRRTKGRTRTKTKRRTKRGMYVMGTENGRSTMSMRGQRLQTRKLAWQGIEKQYFRVQGLTQYDTSGGLVACTNRTQPGGAQYLPVHAWDITSLPHDSSTLAAGFVMTKASVLGSAVTGIESLISTDALGIVQANTNWINENTSAAVRLGRRAIHSWTQVAMNLYGVRNRTTKWCVQLIKIKQEGADFITGDPSGIPKQKLIDYMARPYIYSNLNVGDPMTAKFIKVVKSFTVEIDPITLDQVGGAGAIPKMHTLKWFIKHNRVRDYDWNRGAADNTGAQANFDVETTQQFEYRVQPRRRLYLVVRALAPTIVTGVTNNHTPAPDIAIEPTYDFFIRNKFLTPDVF